MPECSPRSQTNSRLAVITGASSAIGLELAAECARNGFSKLVITDDRPLGNAWAVLSRLGASVESVEADLATTAGMAQLYATLEGRPVDALIATAMPGAGKPFFAQDLGDAIHLIDTNITGTLALLHRVGREMHRRGQGQILLAASTPGTHQAVHHGTAGFIDSFTQALHNELANSGVTVTSLPPSPHKPYFLDPPEIARIAIKAMMAGEGRAILESHSLRL